MKKMKKLAIYLVLAFLVVSLVACVTPEEEEATYTYNYSMSVFPTNWNPHVYETATDAEILGYTESGFYTFDYNETKDGYKIVPQMATDFPIDVTKDYAGEEAGWGIEEGVESGRAYRIPLRDDLKWQDGTVINAESFVDSAKKLLNPEAGNYRADSLYQGDMVIKNAKNYYYQGQTNWYPADTPYTEYSEELDSKLVFTLEGPSDANNNSTTSLRSIFGVPASWTGAQLAAYVINAGYVNSAFTAETAAALEGKTYAEIKADETLKAAFDTFYIDFWGGVPEEIFHFFITEYTWPEVSFDNVGVFEDDGDLVLILEQELSGFYLHYSLTGSWLVHKELYEKCETIEDGVYRNSYGTTLETTMSYGPYKLTSFQLDKQFTFEKNENWFGYNDEANKNLYQTTNVVVDYVTDDAVKLQNFLSGKTDSYGLRASDMAEYADSEQLYYTEGASTFFIAVNPDKAALEAAQAAGENKTIMTVLEFRQALSFAVDRVQFCLACDPTGIPAKGVFNNLIISDPENGIAYRTNEQAKDVLLNFWGLTDQVGEGKRYATKDEAIASITGVDLTQAKEKFTAAYNKAIEEGLMSETDKVVLTIGIPSTAEFYTKGYDFLVNCWTNAVIGTPLEGKLEFNKDETIKNDFAGALKTNKVQVLFGVGWNGAALNPYSLAGAYTLPSYQYDTAISYAGVTKDITFDTITDKDGTVHENITLRATVDAWSNKALAGQEIVCAVVKEDGTVDTEKTVTISAGTNCPLATRTLILCAIEGAILEQYTMLPLDDEASASLKGMQIKYYTEQYVYGVGRGGIKYMTYNYTDAEWEEFVASKGGNLNYAAG